MIQKNRSETSLYVAGWGVLVFSILFWLFYQINPWKDSIRALQLPCLLHALTGYYCPGCGGTRAVIALFELNLVKSFIYHPLVVYTLLFGGWFMFSQTVERLSKGRVSIGMRYRDVYLWIALAIVIINFILKNIALFWGTDLLNLY